MKYSTECQEKPPVIQIDGHALWESRSNSCHTYCSFVLNIPLSSLLFAQIVTEDTYPLVYVSYTTILPLTLLFPVKFSVFSAHPSLCTSTIVILARRVLYHSVPICSFWFGGGKYYGKLACVKFFQELFIL